MLLKIINNLGDDDLALLGCERITDEDGQQVVVVSLNQRPINLLEAEHMSCKLFILFERIPGGARSKGRLLAYQSPYCHPIRNWKYSHKTTGVADCALSTFKRMVDRDEWVRMTQLHYTDLKIQQKEKEYIKKVASATAKAGIHDSDDDSYSEFLPPTATSNRKTTGDTRKRKSVSKSRVYESD